MSLRACRYYIFVDKNMGDQGYIAINTNDKTRALSLSTVKRWRFCKLIGMRWQLV